MISLPDVWQKHPCCSYDRHPLFFEGVRLSRDGLQVVEVEEFKFDQSTAAVNYFSNYNVVIFEASALYFVIGGVDCTTFTIIHRMSALIGDVAKDTAHQGDRQSRARNAKKPCKKPSAASTPSDPVSGLLKQVRICLPEYILQVAIQNDQIFFRSENAIHIYTPFSTSKIDVQSVDMHANYFLYILTSDRILIYGETLIDEVEIEVVAAPSKRRQHIKKSHVKAMLSVMTARVRAVSKILVTGDAMFIARQNILYKVVDDECVFIHDCVRTIAYMRHDNDRIYVYTNGRVTSIGLHDDVVTSTEISVDYGFIHLTESFVVVHNRRNGVIFLDKRTLLHVHSEMISTEYISVCSEGRSIHYLSNMHIFTHTNQRLHDGADVHSRPSQVGMQCDIKYSSARAYGTVEVAMGGVSETAELDKELQQLIDNKKMGQHGQPQSAVSSPQQGTAEKLLKLQELCGARAGHCEIAEPACANGSTEMLEYAVSSKGKDSFSEIAESCEFLETAAYLELIDSADFGKERADFSQHAKYSWECTGTTNPQYATERAQVVTEGSTIITTYRQRGGVYRRSGFFISNHYDWFKEEYMRQHVDEEVFFKMPVYVFIEGLVSGKKKISEPPKAREGNGGMQKSKKKKLGGGGF